MPILPARLLDALNVPMTTPEIAAELLSVSPRTACRMLDKGDLPGVKLGSVRRFRTGPLRKIVGLDDQAPQAA